MGKLVEIKTKPTTVSVEDFINTIADEQKRNDSNVLLKLIEEVIKEKPKMWGTAIIGFHDYRFKSPATGREVDWFKIGFSPRKASLTVYGLDLKNNAEALSKLGKHKTGKGCLYINKLDDVDLKVLEKMIAAASKSKT